MSHLMSLSGVKRTCRFALHVSAFDTQSGRRPAYRSRENYWALVQLTCVESPTSTTAHRKNRELSALDAVFNEAATLQNAQFLCARFALTVCTFFHSGPGGIGDLAGASWLGWSLSQHRGGG